MRCEASSRKHTASFSPRQSQYNTHLSTDEEGPGVLSGEADSTHSSIPHLLLPGVSLLKSPHLSSILKPSIPSKYESSKDDSLSEVMSQLQVSEKELMQLYLDRGLCP